MIYLIDDNQFNQREQYFGIDYIDTGEFDSILKSIEKIVKVGDLSHTEHLEFLLEADCILIHSSFEDSDIEGNYLKKSQTNVFKIKEIVSKKGQKIPLVLFSSGMSGKANYDANENPFYISKIDKAKLYNRLYDFLEYYKVNKKVELRILAHGPVPVEAEIEILVDELLESVIWRSEYDKIYPKDIPLEKLRSFLIRLDPDTDFEHILSKWKSSPIYVKSFRDRIKEILNNN